MKSGDLKKEESKNEDLTFRPGETGNQNEELHLRAPR
jgi:hypothetical protein